MPKKIAPEVREKAMTLYLQGDLTAKEISEELQRVFKVSVKVATIYAWSRDSKWNDKQIEARAEGMERVGETESARFARLQREHLDTYESIRHKASHDLDGLPFDRAIEAVRAVDIGIQGEREVMEGVINLQFVQDVLGVIVEEIQDPDILKRISLRLKTLVQSQD
tara:strand:+ start:71 stop:568 length:498 start_codon:yes stop_codon:yes gene_type:complete